MQNKNEIKKLTSRELEILKLIIQEMNSNMIAERLNISKRTVDNHRANILRKTNSNNLVGLIKYALMNQIIN